MANNRLYIVNTETKEYVCIAKHLGGGWGLGNVAELRDFLAKEGFGNDFDGKTPFLIGTENDEIFYDAYIANGINKTEGWEYA
ncbi:MAG TPA: hypothetical protein VFT06_10315 [Flavisolibacter sp.]|nr:hypothetical protein [Flavisolibacter sp.]